MTFADELGIDLPVARPSVRSSAVNKCNRDVKNAPGIHFDIIGKLGTLAEDTSKPGEMQLAAALFALMIYASLRFCDIRDVSDLWRQKPH